MTTPSGLPLKPIKRVMRSVGAGRISEGAIGTMHNYLVEYCRQITAEAVMLQGYSKRRTLAVKDVEMARRRLF